MTCTGAIKRLGSSLDSPSRGARADAPFGRCWPSSASVPSQPGFPRPCGGRRSCPSRGGGVCRPPFHASSQFPGAVRFVPPPPALLRGNPPQPSTCGAWPCPPSHQPVVPGPAPEAVCTATPPSRLCDNLLCVPLSSGPVLGVESTVPSVSVAQQPPSSRSHRASLWHLTSGSSPEHLWGREAERVSVLWVGSAGGGLVVRSWPYWAHSPWSPWGTWAGGGASSAWYPSCGPVPVGGAAVVPSQTCAPWVTAPVSPDGRPCAPAQASAGDQLQTPWRARHGRSGLGWASLAMLSMRGCEDGPLGRGEGLLRRAARARCLDFPRIKVN